MRDAGEFSREDLLRSWKEIASYLGVEARTCHRWESDRGMPVHRSERNGKKSPVFAYKSELDAWFKETFKSSGEQHETRPARRTLFRVAVGAAILAAAGGLSYLLFQPPGQPADFHIEGSFFVALDKKGREIWRHDTRVENLRPESSYRDHFQVIGSNETNALPLLIIRDIDGDGDSEVLFAVTRITDRGGEGTLICWDRRGRERWRFQAGRPLESPAKQFGPDYRIAGIYGHDFDRDGREEIAVESYYASDWPCQLAVLDAAGEKIGEFWNSGYLRDAAGQDIDGDGRDELLICGVNNEYRGGCLVVFDPRRIAGGSPQTGDFVLEGVGPGSMLYYVTTPYTDVSEASGIRVDGLGRIDFLSNGWIEASASVNIIYDFDTRFRCIQVTPGHGFIASHEKLYRAGAITSVYDDNYIKMLRDGVRYWDGTAWSAEPTPVER